jgi:uncharacterized protein
MPDGSDNGGNAPPRKDPKCPICGRATHAATRPFCSPRCANVDLSRWLNNGYAIVTHADAEEDETLSPQAIAGRGTADETGER